MGAQRKPAQPLTLKPVAELTMSAKTYNVYRSPEGSGSEFIGSTTSIREARKLVARHGRGEISGLTEDLWATARAAGHCGGCEAPEGEDGEPVLWCGRGGWYCVCPVIS